MRGKIIADDRGDLVLFHAGAASESQPLVHLHYSINELKIIKNNLGRNGYLHNSL